MSPTINITPSFSSPDRLGLSSAALLSHPAAGGPRHGVPFTVPKGELYYWTARWQADEQESLDSITRGDVELFNSDDSSDAVRWLLSDDEE